MAYSSRRANTRAAARSLHWDAVRQSVAIRSRCDREHSRQAARPARRRAPVHLPDAKSRHCLAAFTGGRTRGAPPRPVRSWCGAVRHGGSRRLTAELLHGALLLGERNALHGRDGAAEELVFSALRGTFATTRFEYRRLAAVGATGNWPRTKPALADLRSRRPRNSAESALLEVGGRYRRNRHSPPAHCDRYL